MPSRRRFLYPAIAAPITLAIAARGVAGPTTAAVGRKLKKAVKFGMIQTHGSIKEKFELIKSLGFQGVEFDSPADINRDEAVAAQRDTGIKIHGVIDSVHWQKRLSDPDPAVRAEGLVALKTAIADAKTYGSTSILLVPGKVTNKETENFDQ